MLTTIKGYYDHGQVILQEDPRVSGKTSVIITFLSDEPAAKNKKRIPGGLKGRGSLPEDFDQQLTLTTRTGKDDAVFALKISSIESANKIYILKNTILFQVIGEGKGVIIENEQLDIFAAGKNEMEAKNELAAQFEHTYNRFNDLADGQLSPVLLQVKNYYKFIIDKVIDK